MVNGTGLKTGSIARLGACGVEIRIDNELAEVGRFSEGDRGGFGKKVLG